MNNLEREDAIKDLMSLIYKVEIKSLKLIGDTIEFDMGLPLLQSQNIYTFIFKDCLGWAEAEGYDLCPKMGNDGNYVMLTCDNILGQIIKDKFIVSDSVSPASNRIDAILKSCLWIRKDRK